jgi:hypothetical protein
MLPHYKISVAIKVSENSQKADGDIVRVSIEVNFRPDRPCYRPPSCQKIAYRPCKVPIYADGRLRKIVVPGHQIAALVHDYWDAVRQFLETNDPKHLAPFEGIAVVDVAGRSYVFETRLNILYRLSIVS